MGHENMTEGLDSVAVVGMSCRFPGAGNIDQFWQNLIDGLESVSRFSADDLAELGIDPQVLRHANYVNARGVLNDIEMFDASFFGYSPREAEILDPQQRLFLECAWEALESAGCDPDAYSGLIGVYAGVGMSKYLFNLYSNPNIINLVGPYQISLANDKDHITTRTAYKLNLRGPAITLQTACSTSLVAVCTACRSLLDYHCDMALAGGSAIDLPQKIGYFYQEGGIASPDGHCRAFDADARGTVGGNGVGVVLLKRLSDALADNDPIHAIILGSAVNNDGALKVGYTAPSVDGQAAAIAMAHAVAGVEPDSLSYIEAHGTGTTLGDPIEIAALAQVFREQTERKQFCAIGSVKTNIGHLDTAAGVASLIKTVLALKHKLLPPSLHFHKPNPKIDLANSPFYVNTGLADWKVGSTARRAGVSSFGIGGTNAHVVLQEAPEILSAPSLRAYQLLSLSARTPTALDTASAQLVDYLRQHADLDLADVAYTYHVGRRAFEHRRILVCSDTSDTTNVLTERHSNRVVTGVKERGEREVVFLFPGQGAQYVHMAEGIYRSEPLFRQHVDHCAELLAPYLGHDLRHTLFPANGASAEAEQAIQQTATTQPALFVVEYALARLWMSWGIQPTAMIGHSIGEYAAACLAGVFSLEDALAVVAARGRLIQQLPVGAMLAVALPEPDVLPLLKPDLALAAVNTVHESVVSGPIEAIERFEAVLAERGMMCRRLRTSHAFHSAMTDPMLDRFAEQLQAVRLNSPSIPFVSNLTGAWITAEQATSPQYWTQHVRQTVRFADGVRTLRQKPDWVLLEVGPGRTLTSLAQQHAEKHQRQLVLSSLRPSRETQPEEAFLLTTLGRLWLAGATVDWANFYAAEQRRRVALPTYPFERQRFWVDAPKPMATGQAAQSRTEIDHWFYAPEWLRTAVPRSDEPRGDDLCWLVFADRCGVAKRLLAQLQRAGHQPVSVSAGSRFAQLAEHAYTINPASSEDYSALFASLQSVKRAPSQIVHCWSITPERPQQTAAAGVAEYQNLGFYSLLFLAQAIGGSANTQPIQLNVISNQLHNISGHETLCPAKATVLGPCTVIPQEYSNIRCRSIDITLPEDNIAAALAGQVVAECLGNAGDRLVAYRAGERWVQTFVEARSHETTTGAPALRERGTYLITGGLGGIGLVLAEHLARTVKARLVLVGRSAFPARDLWARWQAEHGAEDAASRKIKAIQAMEAIGAEVMVMSADVGHPRQMHQVMDAIQTRFDQLHGVIHAAGVPGGGIIQLKTRGEAERVMAPKVAGALALDEALADLDLDFVALCSSLASVLGGAGQVDYCAANAFLDAFAHANAGKRRVVAINWDRWREVGMAVGTQAPADLQRGREASGWNGIGPVEGVQAFERALRSPAAQVAVATFDFRRFLAAGSVPAGNSADQPSGEHTDQPLYERPALAHPYVAPESEIEQTIAGFFEALLGVQPVGALDNFFELGGHSLLAIQLISRLRGIFHVELPMQTIFESPTVAGLAKTIETIRWAEGRDAASVSGETQEYEEGEL